LNRIGLFGLIAAGGVLAYQQTRSTGSSLAYPGLVASVLDSTTPKLHASGDALVPPSYPWSHTHPWQAFDRASVRRGYEVYKASCAQCHSLSHLYYRSLVGTVLTEAEAKAEAAEIDVEDGPNEDGEMFDRPGKLTDPLPKPYANEEQARASNNMAYPPDLSLIQQARTHHEDYIFALLTGYRAPPVGVELPENMYYNPYFLGGQIGMAQALKTGIIDYEDGTEASISQMAKDVSVFLTWAANPEQDDRKKMGIKAIFLFALMAIPSLYWKKYKWSVVKTRQVRVVKK